MKNPTFRDNVTIITGASLGIGRELALQLAGQGACLALAARSTEKLAELSVECNDRGGRAIPVLTDVADQRQCQALIERTVQEYGRIDTLINNAGVGMAARFDQLEDLELFEKVFRINFFGSVYCTFYALPYLVKTRGRLVAVASGRGLFPSASADAYGPSKHAMVGFFNSLRNELAPGGVSVTLIFPEWVSTGITARALRMDGVPTGELSRHEINAMSVETCAHVTIKTIEKRKRQVIMNLLPKLGLWMRLIAPAFIDRVASSKTE